MGQCGLGCISCGSPSSPWNVALKFPNGVQGIEYQSDGWSATDINQWIQKRYENKGWTSWMIYNDDTNTIGYPSIQKRGHCKGIVTWNSSRLSWMIHSVPNFPRIFDGSSISPIELGEMKFGQSFFYMEIETNEDQCTALLHHILKMDPHIFLRNGTIPERNRMNERNIQTVQLSPHVMHILKPPHLEMDIYFHIAERIPTKWYIETWIRGKAIMTPHKNIYEIQLLTFGNTSFQESQDHSKWGVSDDHVWIGDLNRMTSQFHRGGGGVLIHDSQLAAAFRTLIKTTIHLTIFSQ